MLKQELRASDDHDALQRLPPALRRRPVREPHALAERLHDRVARDALAVPHGELLEAGQVHHP